ncbi:YkgJ family cysteine cluster protein [Capnocytophaga canimorsus]|uniref:YkgJ family cysteine cluster protein n=1 Tax=Capnocytophaga canimorsus TaxID=28188 RepID=UPI000D6E5C62|nr:YkgJ family cysteine cluster protein [Capnocytophaga canimorsus]AWL77908.1 zinc/iron-chelating domain-containing protein [Capnocytophaga canimorsus]AYW36511.1 YkgJ family cysteine cluster protein [Capnocytophaga canimorsus]MDT9499088.1 YkgJ family cysteine cluster protein [Capnocytophaga canimorsus]
MKTDFQQLKVLAKKQQDENKKFFARLKKKPPKDLDYQVQQIHDEVFENTDCLQCANCCKTTGPLFTNTDIERIAKHLRLKPQDFVSRYLYIDEDKDYVFQTLPCPFLDAENYCLIYEVRPKACREYPHTDRKKIYQISALTMKNTEICPAAFEVVERMKARIKEK